MGELLRRYWQPIAAVAELDEFGIKPVRLTGEDLVLYRDGSGHYGLVDRDCPHRRADLLYSWTEECGIRCNYHGWKFDETGACVHQPFEETAHPDARFRERIKIKAYRAEAKAGMIFAYMGPEPAPLNPSWESFTYENGFTDLPCNWRRRQSAARSQSLEAQCQATPEPSMHGSHRESLRAVGLVQCRTAIPTRFALQFKKGPSRAAGAPVSPTHEGYSPSFPNGLCKSCGSERVRMCAALSRSD